MAIAYAMTMAWAWGVGPAERDPADAVLTWNAPAECPTHDEVARMAADLLPTGLRPAPGIGVRADVERDAAVWRLRLRVHSSSGTREREVLAERCQALAQVAAMELALLVDAQSEKTPVPPIERSRTVAYRPRHWIIRAGTEVGAGVLPGAAIAATVGAAWRRHNLGVELDVTHWFSKFAGLPEVDSAGARVAHTVVSIGACAPVRRGRWALVPCAGPEVGVLHGRGTGLSDNRTGARPSFALRLGPALAVTLAPWIALSLGAWAKVSIVRPAIGVDGVGTIFRTPPLGAGGTLRVEIRPPRPKSGPKSGPKSQG